MKLIDLFAPNSKDWIKKGKHATQEKGKPSRPVGRQIFILNKYLRLLHQGNTKMNNILMILLLLTLTQAESIKFTEIKLLSDSLDLPKIGLDLRLKYNVKLPEDTCLKQNQNKVTYRLNEDFKVVDIKTENIDSQRGVTYYEIFKKDKKIFKFKAEFNFGAYAIHSECSWEDNWEIEYDDHIVINGQDLNKKCNYQKSYCFHIYNNKPTYFFERNNKLWIKIGEKEYELMYKFVLHYLCCEPSIFNVRYSECKVYFYTKRNGFWYYVTIEEKIG